MHFLSAPSIAFLGAIFASVASAAQQGEFPVINGVIGGVPHCDSSCQSNLKHSPSSSNATSPKVSQTAGKLRYVKDSGVCETTPGVFQASGYVDIAANKSMWFWFFAARSNSASAPVSVWLNGGPGSSSMIGLLQENGPCRINDDTRTVSHNDYSWNNDVNMLYIDQPVGVGFSYGTTNVGTSKAAAADMWQFLQIFYSDPAFSKYESNPFAIWTESYGGHYGPAFAAYILQQNAAIKSGSATGKLINFKTLGVGNGLTDPLLQYPGYAIYAKTNPYRQTSSDSVIARANSSFYQDGGCQGQIRACYEKPSNSVCSKAQSYCNSNVLSPPAGDYDVYDVRVPEDHPYPPSITKYLTNETLAKQIGAETKWKTTSQAVYTNFASTGDWMYNSSPDLQTVIDAGIRVVVYNGDADYIVNYVGVEAMVAGLQLEESSVFAQRAFSNWTVSGHPAGLYSNSGSFSYVRIFGAGHEVPAYNFTGLAVGQAALQMFNQAMLGLPLTST